MNINCLLGHMLNVISPAECASCGKNAPVYPFPVCSICVSDIISSGSPEKITSDITQKICSCLEYTPAVKCCLKSFKFEGNKKLAAFFRKMIISHMLSEKIRKEKYDVILPVPLHRSRKRKRGYNQSEILAEMVSTFLGVPLRSDMLIKIRNTPPQSGLGKTERKKNLKGSFDIADKAFLRRRSVLVVDDVMTTGATIEECAVTILNAGAATVSAFTLARVT
jgi:competence protein ComFC